MTSDYGFAGKRTTKKDLRTKSKNRVYKRGGKNRTKCLDGCC
ncbi:MAG: hypothetical protein WC796_01735 [Candidatus Pacearchaeota archaeon]|jgi:hypothetical protein